MNSLSVDLRRRIVAAYERDKGTYAELAQRFGVGEATVSRLLRRQRELGHVVPEPAGGGFPPRTSEDEFPDLLRLVAEMPDATLDQLKDAWRTRHGVDLSRSSMLRCCVPSKEQGSLEKKRFRPSEQLRRDVEAKRVTFLKEVKNIPPDRLIFIDESGCNIAMSPTYGRAPRGQRVIDHKPANWGQNVSIVGAVRADRVLAHQTFDGAVNGPKFIDFVRRRLVPRLYPGDVVVLDNLRAHHAPEVRLLVEGAGARLLFHPPYSPDFSPIEPC